jgi:hypothetical protein
MISNACGGRTTRSLKLDVMIARVSTQAERRRQFEWQRLLSHWRSTGTTSFGQADRHLEAGIALREHDIAPMMPDDCSCDREAKAVAASLPVMGCFQAKERGKHLLIHLARNARSIVFDDDMDWSPWWRWTRPSPPPRTAFSITLRNARRRLSGRQRQVVFSSSR